MHLNKIINDHGCRLSSEEDKKKDISELTMVTLLTCGESHKFGVKRGVCALSLRRFTMILQLFVVLMLEVTTVIS